MQYVIECNEFVRSVNTRCLTGAERFYPFGDPQVEFCVGTHRVKDTITRFENTGQNVIDIVDRKCIVCGKNFDGAVRSGPGSMPQFLAPVAIPAKQDVLPVVTSGREYRHRVRLGEPAQIVKIAILPIAVLDVAIADLDRRTRQNGDTVFAHHPHECLAALGKFLSVHHLLLRECGASVKRR